LHGLPCALEQREGPAGFARVWRATCMRPHRACHAVRFRCVFQIDRRARQRETQKNKKSCFCYACAPRPRRQTRGFCFVPVPVPVPVPVLLLSLNKCKLLLSGKNIIYYSQAHCSIPLSFRPNNLSDWPNSTPKVPTKATQPPPAEPKPLDAAAAGVRGGARHGDGNGGGERPQRQRQWRRG
jgi:hypothetical protein